jgi:curved DNA-binding protein CbpA
MLEAEAVKLLGLSDNERFSEEEIKKAWKKLIIMYHPDKSSDSSSNERTKMINEAKEILLRRYRQEGVEKSEDLFSNQDGIPSKLRKRKPNSRVHSSLEDYEEGRDFIKRVKKLFQDNYEPFENGYVYTRGLLKKFIESNESTTELEKRLFRRNCVRLFKSVWPEAEHSRKHMLRCFKNVREKT